MATEGNTPGDAYEPSPTSAPPSDVDIPVESIYGDNVPIAPPEPKKPQEEETRNLPPHSQSTKSYGSSSGGNTIKIGIIPFMLVMLALGSGIFILGNKFRVNIKDGTPIIEQSEFTSKLPETTERDDRQEEENNENQDAPKKQRRTINFLRDMGLYKRENSYRADELASSRLKLAKKTIIWVTSEPNNEQMLSLLSAIKNRSPLPIFVVTGAETSNNRIQPALNAGFSVSKVTSTLEMPYSILLIDDRILMDISRENWIWETTDKEIISETAKWANDLLKNAKVLDKTIN
jgi:hypothetical protein